MVGDLFVDAFVDVFDDFEIDVILGCVGEVLMDRDGFMIDGGIKYTLVVWKSLFRSWLR